MNTLYENLRIKLTKDNAFNALLSLINISDEIADENLLVWSAINLKKSRDISLDSLYEEWRKFLLIKKGAVHCTPYVDYVKSYFQ